jgi:hypothetical protein
MTRAAQIRKGIIRQMSYLDFQSVWFPKFYRLTARKIRGTGRGPAGPHEATARRSNRMNRPNRQTVYPEPVVQKVVNPAAPGVEGVIISAEAAKRDAVNARRRALAAVKRAAAKLAGQPSDVKPEAQS